jgi:hypothetical protein
MKEPTNKIKILKTLLESPKKTGQIAIELGYIDDKGHGKYNNISSDLTTLRDYKFIHTIKTNKKTVGAPGTTYDIVYEIPNLRDLFKEYPILIPDLQNNDIILDMLQDDHPEFRGHDVEFTPEKMEVLRDFPPLRFKSYPDRAVMFIDVLIPLVKASEQGFKDDFKKHLRESPTFFKMCLLHDSEHLKDIAQGVHFGLLTAILQDKEKVKTECDSASGYALNTSFYWFCCLVDVLKL